MKKRILSLVLIFALAMSLLSGVEAYADAYAGICVTVKVTQERVTIRQEPNVLSRRMGTAKYGEELVIDRVSSSAQWGHCAKGWVYLAYTDYSRVTGSTPGTVRRIAFLPVRANAGSFSRIVKMLPMGAHVNVYEKTEVRGIKWGRTDLGWVNLYYIRLCTDPADSDHVVGQNPVTPTVPAAGKSAIIVCGTTPAPVRADHEENAQLVTSLPSGTVVKVYEEATSGLGVKWVRIDEGWIHLEYIQYMVGTVDADLTQPNIINSVPADAIAIGYANEKLDVYGGPGYGYGKSGTIGKYRNLPIYERKLDNGISWARTDNGWVILTNVTVTGIGHSNDGVIVRTFFAASVRTEAGIRGTEIAKAMVNAPVNIIETTVIAGETWAKTDLGWISMNYILDKNIPTPPIVG